MSFAKKNGNVVARLLIERPVAVVSERYLNLDTHDNKPSESARSAGAEMFRQTAQSWVIKPYITAYLLSSAPLTKRNYLIYAGDVATNWHIEATRINSLIRHYFVARGKADEIKASVKINNKR